jgi:hypothetical protein
MELASEFASTAKGVRGLGRSAERSVRILSVGCTYAVKREGATEMVTDQPLSHMNRRQSFRRHMLTRFSPQFFQDLFSQLVFFHFVRRGLR